MAIEDNRDLFRAGLEQSRQVHYTGQASKRRRNKILAAVGAPLALFAAYQFLPVGFPERTPKTTEQVMKEYESAVASELDAFYANADRLYSGRHPSKPFASDATGPQQKLFSILESGGEAIAYHNTGMVAGGKVGPYSRETARASGKEYSRKARKWTRNPGEIRADLNEAIRSGKGLVVCALGSRREHFNYLPNGSVDPESLFGILREVGQRNPAYARDKLQAVFFHAYDQGTLFGQDGREADKLAAIRREGCVNAYLGYVWLGEADKAKPMITGAGLEGVWPDGPGWRNFSVEDVALDKQLLRSVLDTYGERNATRWVFVPWGEAPKAAAAAADKIYTLRFWGARNPSASVGRSADIPVRVIVSGSD